MKLPRFFRRGAAPAAPPRPRAGARAGRRQSKAAMQAVRYATSPLLASQTPPWRSKFVVAAIGLGFCVLLGRAAYIQIVGTDFYLKQGESRYARTLELPASRGRILDRNGLILASSLPAPSIWAIPKDLEADRAQRRQLARLLDMAPGELDKRLSTSPNFVWLKRQVDDETARKVAGLKLKGVHQLKEYKRQYPENEATAHLVGFTNIEDRGQEGIELAFQQDLAGRNGSRRVLKDRLGRIVEDAGDGAQPVDGRDITLSIDSRIQGHAYQRIRDAVKFHKAKAGSVVVLDVRTGEVLALANVPSYTPGDRRNLTGAQLRNRALTDTFEPGSTMKPFIIGHALETGLVRPQTVIATAPGRITIAGSTISDSHPHGDLTVAEVIQKSSNVGTVKLAMQMTPKEMWELFRAIGLGQRPDLHFPGVVSGRLRPHKSWRPIEQATMSYGYGLSASLFQLAQAYTVFARDGELIPATLIKQSDPPAGDGVRGVRVFSPATASAVRQMLRMVTEPGGTAPQAQAVGYSTGGKTGTAHKQEGRGYAGNKYRAWFVGIAPIEHPRIVVAVMVDEPSNGQYFGGLVAGPVFSEVVQQTLVTLGVPPDIPVRPRIVVQAEEESF